MRHIITVKHITLTLESGDEYHFTNLSCWCGWSERALAESDAPMRVSMHRKTNGVLSRSFYEDEDKDHEQEVQWRIDANDL